MPLVFDRSGFAARCLRWSAIGLLLVTVPFLPAAEPGAGAAAAEDQQVRLSRSLRYLAADEMEGRGPGTKGIEVAADYVAEQFKAAGLRTDLIDGGPFQKFNFVVSTSIGKPNAVSFIPPNATPPGEKKDPKAPVDPHAAPWDLELGKDYTPLSLGGSGKLDMPLVFVGYGITAAEADFDEYAGIDVKDKAVIIIRRLPQQGNPHSKLGGDPNHSMHAPLVRKVSNAFHHGAAAVIFVTDEADVAEQKKQGERAVLSAVDRAVQAETAFKAMKDPSADDQSKHAKAQADALAEIVRLGNRLAELRDPLLPFSAVGGNSAGRPLPVLHVAREPVSFLLKMATGKTLSEYEKAIDRDFKPMSCALTGWKIAGEVTIDRQEAEVKNVIAVLEGTGPLADETVVVGAHYDHLGLGGAGSLAPGVKEIHNGADDNASGTSALLEVARILASRKEKLPRRVVFIAFTAEEAGLIGSEYYVNHPIFPLDKTIAMLNMDMVGRLRDGKLVVYGTGTAPEFNPLLDEFNKRYGFTLVRKPEGFGPSDHTSFYARQIPVLHFFTDSHEQYHTPRDDADLIDWPGLAKVTNYVADLTIAVATAQAKPQYVAVAAPRPQGGPQTSRPYFGSIPAFGIEAPGMALQGVTKGGPAEKAGLLGGDVIIRLGDNKIGNLDDFDAALRKFKAGEEVAVVVLRKNEEKTFKVVLDPPR